MNASTRHEWPIWLVWSVLAGASVLACLLAEGLLSARLASTAAVALAAVKIHLIVGQYMEISWSHRPLRPLLAGWLVAVAAILITTIWLA